MVLIVNVLDVILMEQVMNGGSCRWSFGIMSRNIAKMHYGLDPVCRLTIDIARIRITLDPMKVDCPECKLKMIEHKILTKCKKCNQLIANKRNHERVCK